jgi:hypothetical protein
MCRLDRVKTHRSPKLNQRIKTGRDRQELMALAPAANKPGKWSIDLPSSELFVSA